MEKRIIISEEEKIHIISLYEQSNIKINKQDTPLWKAWMNPNTGLPVMRLFQYGSEYVLEYEPYGNYIGTPRIGVYVDNKRGAIKFKDKSELQNFIDTFNEMVSMPKPGPGEDYEANFSDGSSMIRTNKSKYIGIADSAGNVQQLSKKYIQGIQKSL